MPVGIVAVCDDVADRSLFFIITEWKEFISGACYHYLLMCGSCVEYGQRQI